uniref:Uncharacterized protein n=1 Tax=Oryza brachyantha TaxID=4533 RepID=J3M0R4_ORYBR
MLVSRGHFWYACPVLPELKTSKGLKISWELELIRETNPALFWINQSMNRTLVMSPFLYELCFYTLLSTRRRIWWQHVNLAARETGLSLFGWIEREEKRIEGELSGDPICFAFWTRQKATRDTQLPTHRLPHVAQPEAHSKRNPLFVVPSREEQMDDPWPQAYGLAQQGSERHLGHMFWRPHRSLFSPLAFFFSWVEGPM